jgi:prephenate dehydrogenase
LANYVLSPIHPKEQAVLCANGFRDTTRVASGSPAMWRDIVMENRRNLSRVLGVFIADLEELKHALDEGDARSVEEFLETAQRRREAWAGRNCSTSPE